MGTTTVNNRFRNNDIDQSSQDYTPFRNIGIEFGFIMVMTAVLGIFYPSFLGLNLSFMHCLVLGVSGALSVYSGIDKNPRQAYLINMGLGAFFLLNAVIGYLVGDPGLPRFGFYSGDQLRTMAPGFMELATTDHLVHLLLSVVFFVEGVSWKYHFKPQPGTPFLHSKGFRFALRAFIFALILTVIISVAYTLRA